MKFRLGGSVSDPLNLLGGDDVGDNCSTCAPSPTTPIYKELEVPDLPPQLMKDPLNLEGKVKNFPVSGRRSCQWCRKVGHVALSVTSLHLPLLLCFHQN